MSNRRLNPDKLLQRAKNEESHEKLGKLKIYLGAAPGVGKTHQMLHDALIERKKGLDVVIGIAEPHGRKEIEPMLDDFEILPRQAVEYQGRELYEFDLDAALLRFPGLILVDEMAHSNVPGLRHKKRWQDIKELLERGIDVYTTLNVQHIESLSDNVAQIVHASIKETVPDYMIEKADTIELVDIPPDDLIKRLHEGKVYIPEQASLAKEYFFRKGNLTALRELALRFMADRVNSEVVLYRQDQGIRHIWPTKEKFLVCVGPGSASPKLIRTAKRMANSSQAEWVAVYVDTPKMKNPEQSRSRAIQNLRLAEQLGAETRILSGYDVVQELMSFSREINITRIMVFKHVRKRWRDLLFRNLADEIVRYSGEIDVYVMTGSLDEIDKKQPQAQSKSPIPWRAYAMALGIIGLATGVNFLLCSYLSASNLIMVYLLGVTFVALFGELGPSLLSSVVSVLAYEFFFSPPYYSFSFHNVQNLLTLVVMLIVSQVISQLTLLIRRQEAISRVNENQTSYLYKLSRQLSSTRGMNNLLNVGIKYIADVFDCEVIALLPINSHLEIYTGSSSNKITLDEKELGIAQWVYEMKEKAGLGTDTLAFSKCLYLPLCGARRMMGVLRICPANAEQLLLPQQIQLLEACVNLIALSLEVSIVNK